MICRFYPAYTIARVRKLTVKQFNNLLSDMGDISKIEAGEGEGVERLKSKNKPNPKAAALLTRLMMSQYGN